MTNSFILSLLCLSIFLAPLRAEEDLIFTIGEHQEDILVLFKNRGAELIATPFNLCLGLGGLTFVESREDELIDLKIKAFVSSNCDIEENIKVMPGEVIGKIYSKEILVFYYGLDNVNEFKIKAKVCSKNNDCMLTNELKF